MSECFSDDEDVPSPWNDNFCNMWEECPTDDSSNDYDVDDNDDNFCNIWEECPTDDNSIDYDEDDNDDNYDREQDVSSDESEEDDCEQELTINDDIDGDDDDDDDDNDVYEHKKKEESEVKTGSRKRKGKSKKESTSAPKKQKVESTSKVSQKSKQKLRKNKQFSKKNSSKKNRKKRPPAKISPRAIRKFSAREVKISKSRMKWARDLANTLLESIRRYCKEYHDSKEIFSHFEFTGSFYERLKTKDADELDVIVALDTKKNADLVIEKVRGVHGYALIKVTKESSKYHKPAFLSDTLEGYIDPTLVRSWFFGVVQKAVNEYDKTKKEEDPELKLSDNGPAATLVIVAKKDDKELKLSIDLVPAFLFKPKKDPSSDKPVKARRYVAKSLPKELELNDFKEYPREMLWRQSFSFEEKKIMKKMDAKDQGCRHEVVKVMKTIRENDKTVLNKLKSYHIKTAFLHYNFDEGQENLQWCRKHLTERLLGLMEYLKQRVSEKKLSHFFIDELNLLEEFSPSALDNIGNRLSNLISNEKDLKKALKQPDKTAHRSSKTKRKRERGSRNRNSVQK